MRKDASAFNSPDGIPSPFQALANTLMKYGLPTGFAWAVAIIIVLMPMLAGLYVVAKLKGWVR